MSQDCIKEVHVNAVIEQLEKVVELIRENPEKGVGLKITSIIDISVTDDQINNAVQDNNVTTMEVHRDSEVKLVVLCFLFF